MADSAAAADITFSEQAVVYPGTAKKQAVSPIRIVPERNADPQTSLRALPCYGLAKLHGDYLPERPEVRPIARQIPDSIGALFRIGLRPLPLKAERSFVA